VLCLILTGCDDVLVTAKLDPIQDDRVVGVWANSEDPADLGVIEKSGDGYAIQPEEPGGKPNKFTLSRVGEAVFAQMEEKCANHVFSFAGDTRTCYQLARLDFEGDSFVFQRIDLDKFRGAKNLNVQHIVATAYEKRGDHISCALINAPAADLLAFLTTYPRDAFTVGGRMLRRK
jgi:hypothetical protein